MHQKTYDRLYDEAIDLDLKASQAMMRKLERLLQPTAHLEERLIEINLGKFSMGRQLNQRRDLADASTARPLSLTTYLDDFYAVYVWSTN